MIFFTEREELHNAGDLRGDASERGQSASGGSAVPR